MTSPVLIIDCEGGLVTLRHRQDIDTKEIRSVKQIEDIYSRLYASIETDEETGRRSMYYKTVCVDTLTELQKLDMQEIVNEVAASGRQNFDKDAPAQREWGKTSNHIRKIVRAFRDLPCNTIFTAHSATTQDANTNIISYYPSLPGKLKVEISGFLDIVGFMSTEVVDDELVRKVQFTKTQRVTAKDRTGALGDLVYRPTIPDLWDKIHTQES